MGSIVDKAIRVRTRVSLPIASVLIHLRLPLKAGHLGHGLLVLALVLDVRGPIKVSLTTVLGLDIYVVNRC